jgi:CubicO group peptidase (beta-lactamase class C family)
MLRTTLFACVSMVAWGQVPSTYDGNCPDALKQMVESLRTKYNVPGIQIAMANGNMYCAGAIGYADQTTQRALTPTSLMRIGSISKTITGMAIVKLLDEGKINLEAKAVSFVSDLAPPGGFTDARWNDVTVRHLLHHTMGSDRAIGGEPAQNTVTIANALGLRAPADSTAFRTLRLVFCRFGTCRTGRLGACTVTS